MSDILTSNRKHRNNSEQGDIKAKKRKIITIVTIVLKSSVLIGVEKIT